jgi:hypothetical protein
MVLSICVFLTNESSCGFEVLIFDDSRLYRFLVNDFIYKTNTIYSGDSFREKNPTGSRESVVKSAFERISGFSLIVGCLPSIASQ